MVKMKVLSRTVYGLVGLSGLSAIAYIIMTNNFFSTMGVLSSTAYLLLTIGGINWGIVAITGNRNSDLFGLLKQ